MCFFKKEITVCLFVDDMIVLTDDMETSREFVNTMKEKFDTKLVNDGSPQKKTIKYDILGLELTYQFGRKMSFVMGKSLKKKLPNLGVANLDKPMNQVPGTPNFYVSTEDFEINKEIYDRDVKGIQRVVGLLSYVSLKYRFDLLYYVNVLAKHTLYPSKDVKSLTRQLVTYP